MPHLVVWGHILSPGAESDQRAEWHNTTFVSNAYVARVGPIKLVGLDKMDASTGKSGRSAQTHRGK